jgi:putative nucleotidyltransferase with HDIG domain
MLKLTGQSGIRVAVAATAAAAAASLSLLAQLPAPDYALTTNRHLWGYALLILLTAAAEALSIPIVISRGRQATSSVAAICHLATIALFGPLPATVATAIGETLGRGLFAKQAPIKLVFNIAQLTLATAAAGVAYKLLGGRASPDAIALTAQVIAAFLVAAGTYFLINASLVTTILSLDSGQPFRRTWRDMTRGAVPGVVASAALGLALALLYAKLFLAGVVLLLVPMLFLHHANQTNIQLQQLNRDLLTLIVRTIEAKDPYTSGHSLRVAQLARKIAQQLKLGSKEVELVETAALLHDFGKIDFSYGEIISQPGPLSGEQRALIRSHPTRGAQLLASISTLDSRIVEAVQHHHENFDGTGYPDGLSGEEIPLAARIIMVADTVDAMLSARPYRPALTAEKVKDELRKLSGKQFDPKIVGVVVDSNILDDHETELTRVRKAAHADAALEFQLPRRTVGPLMSVLARSFGKDR